jgi:isoamylase
VFEFNELEYYSPIPGSTTGEHRFNFWGYSTVNFFSPMARYSFAIASGADGAALQQEFKLLVREAHKRGIEVSEWQDDVLATAELYMLGAWRSWNLWRF